MFERELSEQSSIREGLDLVSNIKLQIPALPPTPPPHTSPSKVHCLGNGEKIPIRLIREKFITF